jgi:hypothetical protein
MEDEMPDATVRNETDLASEVIGLIRQGLAGVRFGSLALTIHEGKVTQLEITEKKRFATR